MKKLVLFLLAVGVLGCLTLVGVFISIKNSLPQMISIEDYKPLLVSSVFSRDGKKIGEFFRERRVVVPYARFPKHLVNAFVAAEDDEFFQHKGINYQAIARAMLANLKAGRTVQGGSTITQQVAKTLLLSSERTYTRKIKDALLAIEMEKNLSKEDIIFLYLNQIYFGHGSYGVGVAAETYFRKPVEKLTLGEAAILAGLPRAPSDYSPVINPKKARERQRYVLGRMLEVGFIDEASLKQAAEEPLRVFVKERYEQMAPFYLEGIRQMLVKELGEKAVLDEGLKIYASLDLEKQLAAQKSLDQGLRDLDKRQGYRGPLKTLSSLDEAKDFLTEEERKLRLGASTERRILADGTMEVVVAKNESFVKTGDIVKALVTKLEDKLVYVSGPFGLKGFIEFESMKWARKPDGKKRYDLDQIKKSSDALKVLDVIEVKVGEKPVVDAKNKKKAAVPQGLVFYLEQEPLVEGSLISLDLATQDVLAMVGGNNFEKSEYNRAIQAARQTGSSFKSIVYAAALDKGYTPATPIIDAPLVFEEQIEDSEGQEETKTWKPSNHSKGFGGDIIFRSSLVQSLNIPTVKIIEDIGVPWVIDYARRLGVFSSLNRDFTLALGSSSVTLYEMTRAFGIFGRGGENLKGRLVNKVLNNKDEVILENLTVDQRFKAQLDPIEEEFNKRREDFLQLQKEMAEGGEGVSENKKQLYEREKHFFFENPEQRISPTTSYLITSLLKGTVEDSRGTGVRARRLGREVAGKTGTTNGYYDAWFIGYTPQISTGVWVGFDQEKTLGLGEVGGRSALPIWIEYMLKAHENLPEESFSVPSGIVTVSMDADSGKLASKTSKSIIRQAFLEGTEPKSGEVQESKEMEADFYKEDLSD